MTNQQFDVVVVVGGGCVGLAAAYKINTRYPDLKIALLEKENRLAAHQTGRNSGVIHSGIYYKPGSRRATNCVEGRRELVRFAEEHKIPHDICGKIIVATDVSELAQTVRAKQCLMTDQIGIRKDGGRAIIHRFAILH